MRNTTPRSPIPTFLALLFAAGVLALAGHGCGTTQTTSPLIERLDSVNVSLYTLQLRNQNFAARSASILEVAADSIIRLTSDAAVKKNALTWKIYTLPQLRGALLFSDPLAAQFDAWIFCGQVLDYFEHGGGKENFGPLQPIAVRASRQLFTEASALMQASVSEHDFRRLDSLVARALRESPIQNDLYLRESAVDALSGILGSRDYSIGSAIGRIARDVEDISGMIPIYSEQLPREVRWQAEYILEEHDWDGRMDSIQRQIEETTLAINELTRHLEEGDLGVTIGRIRNLQEYINTLETIVGRERVIVMEEVDRLALRTMERVEAYADAKVDQATSEVYEIVDYVLLRVALLLALALILGIAAVLLLRRGESSRPGAP